MGTLNTHLAQLVRALILVYPLCLIHSRKGNRLHVGSIPSTSTMMDNSRKIEAQKLYDKIGNIKKVAKILHTSYEALKKFIVFKERPHRQIKPVRDTSKYRNIVKQKLIDYKGGKCQICGYNRCINALEFHHLNPKEKDFTISGGTKSFEHIKPEVDKCILVCANCHREIHAGLININLISSRSRVQVL